MICIVMKNVIDDMHKEQAFMRDKIEQLKRETQSKIASEVASLKASATQEGAPAIVESAPAFTAQTQHLRSAPARMLGTLYGNVVAYSAATTTTGCVTLGLGDGSVTLDMSGNNCNGVKCPPCFIITAGHSNNKLNIQ